MRSGTRSSDVMHAYGCIVFGSVRVATLENENTPYAVQGHQDSLDVGQEGLKAREGFTCMDFAMLSSRQRQMHTWCKAGLEVRAGLLV